MFLVVLNVIRYDKVMEEIRPGKFSSKIERVTVLDIFFLGLLLTVVALGFLWFTDSRGFPAQLCELSPTRSVKEQRRSFQARVAMNRSSSTSSSYGRTMSSGKTIGLDYITNSSGSL